MVDVFTKARLREASIETYNQALYAKRPNFTDFNDVDEALFDDDVSFGESVNAAGMRTGILTGLMQQSRIKQAEIAAGVTDDIDPNFDIADYAESDEEFNKRLQPYLQDTVTHSRLIDSLVGSRNAGQALFRLDVYENAQEIKRRAEANGFSGEVLGTLAGIAPDIIATMGVGAIYHGLRGALVGATALSRGQAAVRLGGVGLAEGFTEASVQYGADPTRDKTDIAIGAAAGLLIGAGLGAAFPRLADNALTRVADDAEVEDIVRRVPEREAESGGAAAVTDPAVGRTSAASEARLGKGGNASNVLSSWMSKTPGLKGLSKWALRSPKAVMRDWAHRGAKLEAEGYSGDLVMFDGMNRLTRFSVAYADEVGGKTGKVRGESAQDLRDQFEAKAAAVTNAVSRKHKEFLDELYGSGVQAGLAKLREKAGKTTIGSLLHKGMDEPAFERWADKLRKRRALEARAAAKGEEATFIGPAQIVPQQVLDQIPERQWNFLFQKLDEAGAEIDRYYKEFGEIEKRMGILDPEEVIENGYTPQIWNREAIEQNRDRFERWLTRVFHQEADDEWARSQFPEQIIKGEEGQADEIIPGLREGETFEEFATREPALAREIQETWEDEIMAAEVLELRKLEDAAEAEFARHNAKSMSEIGTRLAKANANDYKLIAKLEDELENFKGLKADKEKIAERIGKAEKRLVDRESRFAEAKRLNLAVEEARKFIGRAGRKADARKSKKLGSKLKRAKAKTDRKLASKYVSERVKEITDKILDQESHFGVVPDGFKLNSSRFKRRAIRLGTHEFDEEADAFLQRDMASLREAYARGVGGQLAVRSQFGVFGKEFKKGDVLNKILAGYDDDLRKFAGNAKATRQIQARRKEAKEMAEYVLKDILGDYELRNKAADQLAGLALTATAALSLGKVMLSQLTDLAIQAFAGGAFETGFKSFFRRNQHVFREMEQDDDLLAVILQGLSTVNGRRFRQYADMDRVEVDVGGSWLHKARRLADDIATAEGYANFMHPWNTHIRGAFGIDFANQIHKHVTQTGWDGLKPSLKTFYSRLGVGKNEFDRMANEFANKGKKEYGGRVTVPDTSKWDQGLLNVYKRAVKAAGDEAMLDPSIADRPFLRASPLGRMVIQFQSFVFTAADRFVAPLVQEMAIHPTEMRSYGAVMMAFTMASLNSWVRAAMRGEGEAYRDRWTYPEGIAQNMQEAFIRGPFAVSGSGVMHEALSTQFGGAANNLIESFTDARPLKESATKFHQQQGLIGMAGPFAGNLETARSGIVQFAEGDVESAGEKAAARIPIINTLAPQLLRLYIMDKVQF